MAVKEWNVTRAAIIGAVLGLGWSILQVYILSNEPPPSDNASLIGNFIGSAVGGAFLFAVISAARNFILRRS